MIQLFVKSHLFRTPLPLYSYVSVVESHCVTYYLLLAYEVTTYYRLLLTTAFLRLSRRKPLCY